ncbi:CLCA1 [Bugula neritina]|uniref:CLCA1 n=1 Tax=Bugula neritina TaxID=10212 RepID=A0A7J7ITI9_BUGNE|nr:CLCA1 [Bugula neritina]
MLWEFYTQLSGVLIVSVFCVSGGNIGGTRQEITLSSEGGYGNILVTIEDTVPENLELIDRLKEYFEEASTLLFSATKEQHYFENITIKVPASWTPQPSWQQATAEHTLERARIIIGPPNQAWGDIPYTLQPGLCGQEGDYTHFTPNYLTNLASVRPEKRIVREFAHLKWGLFDEDVPSTDTVSPKFYPKDGTLRPTICVVQNIFGQIIDTSEDNARCTEYNKKTQEYGSGCVFEPIEEITSATASLMYAEHLTSVRTTFFMCMFENLLML